MNGKHIRPLRKISSVFQRLSIRTRIAASILLAFAMVLPVVGLSLFYYSDLLANIKMLTERDVRLGRSASDLSFIMLDIQRRERNYRVFGDDSERVGILGLISRADSVVQSLRAITLSRDRSLLDDLSNRLGDYKKGFDVLVDYIAEFPPDKRFAQIRSRMDAESGNFPTLLKKIRDEIRSADSSARDSLLAEAVKHIDIFSLDRIVSPGAGPTGNPRTSFLQQSLDSSRRDFITTANLLASRGWANMENHKRESLRIEARAKRNILFVIILTGILCAILVTLLPKSIVKPLKILGAHIRGVGNGSKDLDLAVFPDDEVGALAAAYASVTEKLKHFDDLKTRKIATQKRFIERLIDHLDIPVCILTRTFSAIYMNSRFTTLFDIPAQQKIPENGFDLASLPYMKPFIEEIRKKTSQNPGDFSFSAPTRGGGTHELKCCQVRNTALALETLIIMGETGKDTSVS